MVAKARLHDLIKPSKSIFTHDCRKLTLQTLGLKLEQRRGLQVKYLVIDDLNLDPTEN
jgi:hypothetical protein